VGKEKREKDEEPASTDDDKKGVGTWGCSKWDMEGRCGASGDLATPKGGEQSRAGKRTYVGGRAEHSLGGPWPTYGKGGTV